jgi:hypothetical protein
MQNKQPLETLSNREERKHDCYIQSRYFRRIASAELHATCEVKCMATGCMTLSTAIP